MKKYFSLALLLICTPLRAEMKSCFVILQEGVDLPTEVRKLESEGAIIRQRVPPQILTADIPDALNPSRVAAVQSYYMSAVSVDALQPYGTLAVAAGIQWNRSLLNAARLQSKALGASQANAMRTLVAEKSLPPPTDLNASPQGTRINCSWEPVSGALSYEIEAAIDETFSNVVLRSKVNRTDAALPIPDGASQIFLRVRAVDRPDSADPTADIPGGWSQSVDLSIQPVPQDDSVPAAVLTSPVDQYKSEGFTVILEWMSTAGAAHLQVSTTDDFKNAIVDGIVDGQMFVVPSAILHSGKVYFWRVQSWDDKKGPWSTVRAFEVGLPRQTHSDMFINPEAPK